MDSCSICRKRLSVVDALLSRKVHPKCLRERNLAEAEAARRRREAEAKAAFEAAERKHRAEMEDAEAGRFPRVETDIVMEADEQCHYSKPRTLATFHERLFGKTVRKIGAVERRDDGLVPRDQGRLYVTNRRVCFVGKAKSLSLQLKKVLRCEQEGDDLDAMLINMEGRAQPTHFIFEDDWDVEVIQAAIHRLAFDAKQQTKRPR